MPSTKIVKEVQKGNVSVRASRVAPNAGNGLFAKKPITKGSLICTYAGKLIDSADSKYVDPTYMVSFELGKGFKLAGDGEDGDIGHYANSLTPQQAQEGTVKFNAKIDLHKKCSWVVAGSTYQMRGRFDLVAKCDIKARQEIILDYGKGYWLTMNNWIDGGVPVKSQSAQLRESRYLKRVHSDMSNSSSSLSSIAEDSQQSL